MGYTILKDNGDTDAAVNKITNEVTRIVTSLFGTHTPGDSFDKNEAQCIRII